MVSRSASTWHGWNWSVSAFTTGTPTCAAISSIRDWSNVRQTTAATCRPSTRAVSAMDSRTPILARLPSTSIGYPMLVDGNLAKIGVRESIADTARVLGRQVAAVVWRTFDQSRIEEMAGQVGVPVVNALTDQFHPCQVLADLLTVAEHGGGVGALSGRTLAYLGDGANNMAHSYLLGGATAGLHVRIACPAQRVPDPTVVADAEAIAVRTR